MQFMQIMPPICKICTEDFADVENLAEAAAAAPAREADTGYESRSEMAAAVRRHWPGPGSSSCYGRGARRPWARQHMSRLGL